MQFRSKLLLLVLFQCESINWSSTTIPDTSIMTKLIGIFVIPINFTIINLSAMSFKAFHAILHSAGEMP